MKIDYNITIRLKDKHWYDLAKDFGGVEEFAEWDDKRTTRYRNEVTFRFLFDVISIQEEKNTSYPIKLLNTSEQFCFKKLPGLRVINFAGSTHSEQVIISESLLDQVFIEDKSKSKVYVYCYIKEDVNCYEVAKNIWLSDTHIEELNRDVESSLSFIIPDVELLSSGGILLH